MKEVDEYDNEINKYRKLKETHIWWKVKMAYFVHICEFHFFIALKSDYCWKTYSFINRSVVWYMEQNA